MYDHKFTHARTKITVTYGSNDCPFVAFEEKMGHFQNLYLTCALTCVRVVLSVSSKPLPTVS